MPAPRPFRGALLPLRESFPALTSSSPSPPLPCTARPESIIPPVVRSLTELSGAWCFQRREGRSAQRRRKGGEGGGQVLVFAFGLLSCFKPNEVSGAKVLIAFDE